MKFDPKRAILGLPQYGDVSEDAIRAAYWRIVRQVFPIREDITLADLQNAKRALLIEAGVRIPKRRAASNDTANN